MTDSTKLAYTIPEAAEAVGLSRSMLYEQLSRGKLRAVKCGGRTLLQRIELERWLRSLPQADLDRTEDGES